jgi:DNA-binding Xre family transcriptional regulator
MILESKVDEVLQSRGVSVDTLVEKTGLTRMTIFNARRGASVKIETAIKIAEALEVKVEDIWQAEDNSANVLAA